MENLADHDLLQISYSYICTANTVTFLYFSIAVFQYPIVATTTSLMYRFN